MRTIINIEEITGHSITFKSAYSRAAIRKAIAIFIKGTHHTHR